MSLQTPVYRISQDGKTYNTNVVFIIACLCCFNLYTSHVFTWGLPIRL